MPRLTPVWAALFAVGPTLLLSACGFTPLYATPGMTPALTAVDLVVPHNRTGYLLEEQLDDELGHNGAVPARYQLTCTTKETRYPRGIRVNNVANRYEINLTVNYALRKAGGTRILLSGTAPVIVEYDSPDPPYAGTVANQDGENRAANQAAIQIRLALARYFAGVHAGSHAVATPTSTSLDDDDTN
jgi:LPS-assembly lipoprotein